MTRQEELDRGLVEACTLMEGLRVDFTVLLRTLSPGLELPVWEQGITRKMRQAAAVLQGAGTPGVDVLRASASDTVRGIAAFVEMGEERLRLKERVERIRPYAVDSHFGVREWAWMAVRPWLAAELEQAVKLLTPWTADGNVYARRFAVEALRPRGVWCSHIEALKEQPELGLPLLEPLRAEREKYVQDSVANWLNDAAKTQPAWVREVCARWERQSDSAATRRITKRAQRSLG